eukprot:scaffold23819_cov43-Cyclotella_meneghiniana.AAC.3
MQARSKLKTRTRSTRQQQSSSGCQTSDRGYRQKCKGGVQRDKRLRMAAARWQMAAEGRQWQREEVGDTTTTSSEVRLGLSKQKRRVNSRELKQQSTRKGLRQQQ